MATVLERLVIEIEHFRTHLGMYVHPVDVRNVESFMTGVTMGAYACGVKYDRDVRQAVVAGRQWPDLCDGIVPRMRERGMSERQIIDELIDIEIETLRRSNDPQPPC